DRNDPRRVEFDKALQSTDPGVRRAVIKQAMEIAYDASDERYTRLRDFRNIIVLTAMLITLFAGGLLLAVVLAPDAIPLCFTPNASNAAPADQTAAQVCPSGERTTPSPGDVLIVAGLGALGGGLAALFSIRNLRRRRTPLRRSSRAWTHPHGPDRPRPATEAQTASTCMIHRWVDLLPP